MLREGAGTILVSSGKERPGGMEEKAHYPHGKNSRCKGPEAGLTEVLDEEQGGQYCWNIGDEVSVVMGAGGLYRSHLLAFLNHGSNLSTI